jgi:hypothetical protein
MEIDERLGENMGLRTKEQLRQFIKENKLVTAQDAQNALKEMLEAEMESDEPPHLMLD